MLYPPGCGVAPPMRRMMGRALGASSAAAPTGEVGDLAQGLPLVDLAPVTWLACDRCGKWRRLGRQHARHLPESWRCEDNPDPAFRSCDVPQELPDEEIDRLLGHGPEPELPEPKRQKAPPPPRIRGERISGRVSEREAREVAVHSAGHAAAGGQP